MTLQKLKLSYCTELKELPNLSANWWLCKSYICFSVLNWRSYLHLLVNWRLYGFTRIGFVMVL
jgi:hypothetical protein